MDAKSASTSPGGRLLLMERAQAGLALAFEHTPRGVKRLIAGSPITGDGQTLDLDMQLIVRFTQRGGEATLAT